jgi:hypothetical protein
MSSRALLACASNGTSAGTSSARTGRVGGGHLPHGFQGDALLGDRAGAQPVGLAQQAEHEVGDADLGAARRVRLGLRGHHDLAARSV